jgi:hypothetical protein
MNPVCVLSIKLFQSSCKVLDFERELDPVAEWDFGEHILQVDGKRIAYVVTRTDHSR